MQVSVRFFGEYASYIGAPNHTVELESGSDIKGLLAALDKKTNKDVSGALLFDENTVLPSIGLLVNGKNLNLVSTGLSTTLSDGDQVHVLPLLGGGR